MRCPVCAIDDDRVVDSRAAEEGAVIRRRRQCLACGHRYTTYERLEELPLVVVKRSGAREPFDRAKIAAGMTAAAKSRPLSPARIEEAALGIEEALRLGGATEVDTASVGLAVLERLRELDQVASVRFASVYKGFEDPADFEREVTLLSTMSSGLSKQSEPKAH
ncbi:MAG: transcriptional regulator NrdR [Acidimicrobiales bacterium]